MASAAAAALSQLDGLLAVKEVQRTALKAFVQPWPPS